MKRSRLLLLLASLLVTSATSCAETTLKIYNVWIPEAPPGASVLAGYLIIENPGDTDVQLLEVSSPEFGSTMIHATRYENGMARMEHVEVMNIPAHSKVELKSGAKHLMLMDPKRPLRAGEIVQLNMTFDSGWVLSVDAPVRHRPASQ